MAKENAVLSENETLEEELTEPFDLNGLEEKLQNELEKELSDLEFLKEEKDKIGNPDALGDTIKNVVWEQFLNQIAVTAGEDFIEANKGLTLDLRSESHIQTTENFANGKIASHNTEIDYQKRYDDWQNNFQRNEDGSIKTKEDNRTKEQRAVLRTKNTKKDPNGENYNTNYDVRNFIDKDRPTGSKTVNKDHTISAAEIIRDPEAAAHLTREEQANFANSDVNLVDLDSAANQSKSDSSMSEFLDSERTGKGIGKGQGESQADYFGLDEEELRARDKAAREEYEKKKKEGEDKSIKAGKESQKKEAFRIGGKALRAITMQLLAELVKEIIGKLVKWFKDKRKNLNSLVDSVKSAIKSFVGKLKTHMVNAGNTLITTIATAIIGPVVGTIKKVWMMLKQGWKLLKDAIDFLRNPKNKSMPISIKLLEVGKIVMAGLSGVGALVLGEVIEKGLMAIPVFAVEIPLLGSLANIVGIFMGAVVAGIIGAIAINVIDKATEKKRNQENTEHQVEKSKDILNTQHKIKIINEVQLENSKANAQTNISGRHQEAGEIMRDSFGNIMEDFVCDFSDSKRTIVIDDEDIKTTNEIDRVSDDLDDLLKSLD